MCYYFTTLGHAYLAANERFKKQTKTFFVQT